MSLASDTDERSSHVERRRRTLGERAVRTERVVVLDVLREHVLQVTSSEDEHPVEALAPQGAVHALTDGIGPVPALGSSRS